MADSFTGNLNLRKPEVGAAFDTWGGTAGWNNNADLLDAIFLATGLGSPVGLHIASGTRADSTPFVGTLRVDGGGQLITQNFQFADATDPTKVMAFAADSLPTGTTVTVQPPPASGTLATQEYIATQIPTGTVWHGYYGATPPTGWIFPDGRTIGDATSTATNRANADCLALFTRLWDLGFGVVGGRGASAAADWAAHKQLTLPDHSGSVDVARDNLSGTNRGRLSLYPSTTYGAQFGQQALGSVGVSVNVSGGIGGTASGTLTGGGAVHANATAGSGSGAGPLAGDNAPVTVSVSGNLGVSGSFSGSGSGGTNQIVTVQPTIINDAIIKL